MLEDMDAVAVVSAYAYCKASFETTKFVTVSVKELCIPVCLPVNDYSIIGEVECQTNSTLWIRVALYNGEKQPLGQGMFCMAARDASIGKAVKIPIDPSLIRWCKEAPTRFEFGLTKHVHECVESRNIMMNNEEYLNIYGKIFGGYLMHEMLKFCTESITFPLNSDGHLMMRLSVNFKQPVDFKTLLVLTKWKGPNDTIYLQSHSSLVTEKGPVLCHEFEFQFLSK